MTPACRVIEPDADVVILPFRALSVNLIRAQQFRDPVIIRKDSAAVAIAAQRLGGEEGGGGNIAEGAALFPLVGCAGALSGVLDQQQSVFLADGADLVIFGRVSEEVHRYDCPGAKRSLRQNALDMRFQRNGIKVIGVRLNVAEHGGGAQHTRRLHRRDEGHIRAEHRVPRPDTVRHIDKLEGVGAVAAGNTVLAAHIGGKLFLKFGDFLAPDKMSAGKDPLNVCVDLALQRPILRFQINKFHRSVLHGLYTPVP